VTYVVEQFFTGPSRIRREICGRRQPGPALSQVADGQLCA